LIIVSGGGGWLSDVAADAADKDWLAGVTKRYIPRPVPRAFSCSLAPFATTRRH